MQLLLVHSTVNPTGTSTDQPSASPLIDVVDVSIKGLTTFLSSNRRNLLASANCEADIFAIAVEEAILNAVFGGLQNNEELTSLTVSKDLSFDCTFPFEAKIRIILTCTGGSSCNSNTVGEAGMFVQFCIRKY